MEEYVVSKEYLDELMTEWTKCVMGQCMKRFELHNNDTVLKKEIKELIYENSRDLKVLIRSFSCGVKFNTSGR
jgi:hypothetical protein